MSPCVDSANNAIPTGLSAALILLFCAGWVHCDISCGNVLLWRDEHGELHGKLGDLEYAKRFPSESGSPDPKTVRVCARPAVTVSDD